MFPEVILTVGHWVILGLILLGVELLVPGAFFLWFGFAAILLACITYFHLYAWPLQLILFAVISIFLTWIGRPIYKKLVLKKSENTLNQGAHRFIGMTLTLEHSIINSHSRITIGDSTWSLKGPDLEAGTHVKVIAVEGNVLIIEKA